MTHTHAVECGGNSECNCPLSQSGETCTLSCDEPDICKTKNLNCRQGDPCEIECTSSAACSDGTTINAATATDVTILCEGDNACKVDIAIVCGTGHCILHCNGATSCIDWGSIDVSLSSSFRCIGDCPNALPTEFIMLPTISTTSTTSQPTSKPTTKPTLTSNPSKSATYSHTTANTTQIIDSSTTNQPTPHPSMVPSHAPSYAPSYSPSSHLNTTPIVNFILVQEDNNHHIYVNTEHFNPLFFGAAIFFFIIFCVCCIFCIWVYSNEQHHKRMEFNANAASPIHNPIYAIPSDPEQPMNPPVQYAKPPVQFKDSIESSDLYDHDCDSGNELNEGPIPTTWKIQTLDMMSHAAVMHHVHKLQIEIPDHSLPNLPPPRSLPYPLSPWSSPPQTPIPQSIPKDVISNGYSDYYHVPNHDDICHLTGFEPGAAVDHAHVRYGSLPTVPSLPSITCKERSHSLSSPTHDAMTNNMRVSMVSCMVLDDSDVEHSQSMEWNRKPTYESYDYSKMTARQISQVSNRTDFGSSVMVKSIKLHGIREASRDAEEDLSRSLSPSLSHLSVSEETSVSQQSQDGKNEINHVTCVL
eukprot:236914_1